MLYASELLSGVVGAFIVFVLTVLWAETMDARQRVRARAGYARLLDAELEANGLILGSLSPLPDEDRYNKDVFSPFVGFLIETPLQMESFEQRQKKQQAAQLEDQRKHLATLLMEWREAWDNQLPMLEKWKKAWRNQLSLEVWREVRKPLASLIEVAEFERLEDYYRKLNWLLIQTKTPTPKIPDIPVVGLPFLLQPQHQDLIKVLSGFGELKDVAHSLRGEDLQPVRDMLKRYANPSHREQRFGF